MGNDQSKTCERGAVTERGRDRSSGRTKGKGRSSSYSPPTEITSPRSANSTQPVSPDENNEDLDEEERNERQYQKVDLDGKSHFLPRRDRLLIVKSWRKTQKTGAEHVGSKIFLRVLTFQPEIKAIFGLEKIPQGRLKYDPRFRQHAIVYTKTFDFAVKNLEFADKLEHHFDALGRRHVAMNGRGFDPSFWDTFAECMTQTAAEWDQHRHRPTTCAWRNLVSTIIMFMRKGYDDEMNRKRALFPRTTSVLPQYRKTSGQPATCPYQPTYTAMQAKELYETYNGKRRGIEGERARSQTPVL